MPTPARRRSPRWSPRRRSPEPARPSWRRAAGPSRTSAGPARWSRPPGSPLDYSPLAFGTHPWKHSPVTTLPLLQALAGRDGRNPSAQYAVAVLGDHPVADGANSLDSDFDDVAQLQPERRLVAHPHPPRGSG